MDEDGDRNEKENGDGDHNRDRHGNKDVNGDEAENREEDEEGLESKYLRGGCRGGPRTYKVMEVAGLKTRERG